MKLSTKFVTKVMKAADPFGALHSSITTIITDETPAEVAIGDIAKTIRSNGMGAIIVGDQTIITQHNDDPDAVWYIEETVGMAEVVECTTARLQELLLRSIKSANAKPQTNVRNPVFVKPLARVASLTQTELDIVVAPQATSLKLDDSLSNDTPMDGKLVAVERIDSPSTFLDTSMEDAMQSEPLNDVKQSQSFADAVIATIWPPKTIEENEGKYTFTTVLAMLEAISPVAA